MTRLAFVVGHPIHHSLSPAIHNAAFAACGFDAEYRPVDVEPTALRDWVLELREVDALGCSVTVPHKEAIVQYLDGRTGDAMLVGAVNTVIRSADPSSGAVRLTGANTDAIGFRRSLAEEAGTKLHGQRVLVLGAGGAARSVALVALQDGAEELIVANRTTGRAERLLGDLSSVPTTTRTSVETLDQAGRELTLSRATIVINSTSVGLVSTEMPIDPSGISPEALAVDLIYNPARTAFLQAAERAGARTLSGLGMLVHQAAVAFELWTGVTAPLSVMWEAAEEALLARSRP